MLLKVAGAPTFLTHTNGTTPITASCNAGLVYGVEDWNESDNAMSAVTGASKVNGAAARLGKPGDRLTIMSFGLFDPEEARTHQPKIIVLGENNEVLRQK